MSDMKYLILTLLFLAGCASSPKYVTNEQLHFRFAVYCQQQAYKSLSPGNYNHKDVYDQCMREFGYLLEWKDTREDWQW